jgi:hypothetical protein
MSQHVSRLARWLWRALPAAAPAVGKWRRGYATRVSGAAGMSTAEYAVGTIAACAFAALLYKVVTSTQVFDLLTGLVTRALHTPF